MKKKIFQALFVIWFVATLPFSLHAAYQENIPQQVVQPDGSVLSLLASGDEFFSFLHDADGYTIIQGKDGFYYYAIRESENIVASSYRVGQHDPSSLGLEKRVRISPELYRKRVEEFNAHVDKSLKAPHTGDMTNLVIYIRFSDDTEFSTPRSTFDGHFNLPQGPSLRHYFQEVSYGQLDIVSHHFPESEMSVNLSYQSPNPRSYYQPKSATNPNGYDPAIPTSNGSNTNGRTYREHTLLAAAVAAVQSEIPQDLTLDADGDGLVDNVSFIIRGQHDAWNNLLWAHRWVLWSQQVFIHGKRVYDFTFQPETQSTVYVLCHEMFHTLGAPDLYHYNSSGFTPVGPWDLMHSGFVHMGAYMKWKYAGQQWINEIPLISEPGTYTLNPLSQPENNAFRINTTNSTDEYFVVEYRKRSGHYETNIPGEGLLVYRINQAVGNGNANGPPDEVYLFRLDGSIQSNGNILQAHFSEQVGRTEFSNHTNPHAFLTNNLPGDILITNISAAGETISFNLLLTFDDLLPPGNLVAVVNDNYQVELTWDLPEPPSGENGPSLSGIEIYRGILLIHTTEGPETTGYVDKDAMEGLVSYHVRAIYNQSFVSPSTPVVSVTVPPYLLIDGQTTLDVENESGSQRIEILSNLNQWFANAAQSWVQPLPASGFGTRSLFLYYDSNPAGTPRQTTIAVSGSGITRSIILRQGYSVSIDEAQEWLLRVYPNPSRSGYIMVSLGQYVAKGTLRLIDLTGRTLISQPIDALPGQTLQLSTSELPAGFYLIEVSSPEGVLREKVVVQR